MKKTVAYTFSCILLAWGAGSVQAAPNNPMPYHTLADTLVESSFVPGVFIQPGNETKKLNQMIADFRKQYNESLERWDDISLIITGVRTAPDYYKLVMPATYYSEPVVESMSIDQWKPVIPFVKPTLLEKEKKNVPDLQKSKKINQYINRQLLNFYIQYPQLVVKNESELKDLDVPDAVYARQEPKKEDVTKFVQSNIPSGQIVEKDLLVFKPNFWTLAGNGYLQFSQNHISDNWYKGGESTVSLLAGFTWQANYDDKQRTQFENKVEWKLGFITAPSDTVHSYRTNNDLLRITSKLGYKAIKNWYYTLSAEFKTQFFPNYATNSNNLISSFFSPAELNVGLGMDYKYTKNGVCNLSVLMNPINYTLYSVSSNRVDPTSFNIDEGHKKKSIWGSRVEATSKWKIINALMWESRFSYTTNYTKVQAEWENTFTFTFNKYLSTKLFVHVRYDDGVSREPDESYFQLQELLSFGLNYTW